MAQACILCGFKFLFLFSYIVEKSRRIHIFKKLTFFLLHYILNTREIFLLIDNHNDKILD